MIRLSLTLLSSVKTFDDKRLRFTEFASKQAEPRNRDAPADFYRCCRQWNARYFGGKLRELHLAIGATGPSAFGFCTHLTDLTAKLQITPNQRVIVGSHKTVRDA